MLKFATNSLRNLAIGGFSGGLPAWPMYGYLKTMRYQILTGTASLLLSVMLLTTPKSDQNAHISRLQCFWQTQNQSIECHSELLCHLLHAFDDVLSLSFFCGADT